MDGAHAQLRMRLEEVDRISKVGMSKIAVQD